MAWGWLDWDCSLGDHPLGHHTYFHFLWPQFGHSKYCAKISKPNFHWWNSILSDRALFFNNENGLSSITQALNILILFWESIYVECSKFRKVQILLDCKHNNVWDGTTMQICEKNCRSQSRSCLGGTHIKLKASHYINFTTYILGFI